MPVYEYACTECGTRLEARQSFTDDALTVCPECTGRLRKLLSPVGVVFKGSGFYRTDSRTPPASDGATSGSSTNGAPAEASSNGSGKPDSAAGGDQAPAKNPSKESASTASSASSAGSPRAGSGGAQAGRKSSNGQQRR
jgi:putative FmdB family regulatory protein